MKSTFALLLVSALLASFHTYANTELGITLGTPSGINLGVGTWGLGETEALYLRGSAGGIPDPTGEWTLGGQVVTGWVFDREGSFWQYTGVTGLLSRGEIKWSGVGPVYGFNLSGFSFETGLTFGSGGRDEILVGPYGTGISNHFNEYSSPQLTLQLGYTYIFGR